MLDIIYWLTVKPFLAFFQALAGVLYPVKSPELIRLQRIVAVVLVLGAVAIVAAIGIALWGVEFWISFCIFVAGVLLLSFAGYLGHGIMKN